MLIVILRRDVIAARNRECRGGHARPATGIVDAAQDVSTAPDRTGKLLATAVVERTYVCAAGLFKPARALLARTMC